MDFLRHLADWSTWYPLIQHTVRILIILAGVFVLIKFVEKWTPRLRVRLVSHMMRDNRHDHELEKRAATIGSIFRKTVATVAWIIALVMILREAGFDIGPILAGAGVVGLAIGFGAQNLVRDVISGVLLLLENQVRVNDVAVINGEGGLVERINLRTIVLRGLDGTIHIFPNGSITSLSNMSHGFSYYVFDIGVAYKEDTDRVVAALQETAAELMKDDEYRSSILEPLEVLGVDKFADSAVIIKVRIKTEPLQQWFVGREMNRRIKKKFDELGIEIPFPQMRLHLPEAGQGSGPLSGISREELKSIIREVLLENSRHTTA
ncbi:MAG TPA: mechanosensitive ion channel family protein [Candidatus Eisenbacteria bacterium]|nr:mechanosensitive ion channel family protein [Candidatus Eisenbacteria bacterium]